MVGERYRGGDNNACLRQHREEFCWPGNAGESEHAATDKRGDLRLGTQYGAQNRKRQLRRHSGNVRADPHRRLAARRTGRHRLAQRPAGSARPLKPDTPSTTSSDRSLCSRVLQPSSSTVPGHPRRRRRERWQCDQRRSRSALPQPAVTPRRHLIGSIASRNAVAHGQSRQPRSRKCPQPRAVSRAPISSASVVLPAPPTVTLPQQITGTAACQPGRAARRAVTAAVTAANGDNSRGRTPSWHQNSRMQHHASNSAMRRRTLGQVGLTPHRIEGGFASSRAPGSRSNPSTQWLLERPAPPPAAGSATSRRGR